MMSAAVIDHLSREAASRAAKEHKYPYMVWPQDVRLWKEQVKDGKLPKLPFPFIGSWEPKGYRLDKTYFVDSSGFGQPGEPALTIAEFVDQIKPDRAYAIVEAGQFQVHIGEFTKTKRG